MTAASASPPRKSAAGSGAGMLGLRLFLASLSAVFAATLVAYLVVRARAEVWPPPGVPQLPRTLWVSTVLLVASSATITWAQRGARRGNGTALRRGLALTTLLGLAFLASQTRNWFVLVAANLTMRTNLYGFTFYLLTGLHALHVLGGLGPLAGLTVQAWRGPGSDLARRVVYLAAYWHFLDAVWLVLFAVLLATT